MARRDNHILMRKSDHRLGLADTYKEQSSYFKHTITRTTLGPKHDEAYGLFFAQIEHESLTLWPERLFAGSEATGGFGLV